MHDHYENTLEKAQRNNTNQNKLMKTVHSLSGGKTSSYMAVHYPADYNVFALVTIEDSKCSPKDPGLIKKVSDKIGREFIATAEDDSTLIAMFDLEQLIGKEIIWVTGKSFDQVLKTCGGILPSALRRFCTGELKVKPIFNWWQQNIGSKVKMGIGYRFDEKERADRFTETIKTVIGKLPDGRNKWGEVNWREGWFPMIEDKIGHYTIYKWSQSSGIEFPRDSNCVGCFHKPVQQLRKNWDNHAHKMEWFASKEGTIQGKKKIYRNTWKDDDITYLQIKSIALQQEFNFGTGSGCQAGFCTD